MQWREELLTVAKQIAMKKEKLEDDFRKHVNIFLLVME